PPPPAAGLGRGAAPSIDRVLPRPATPGVTSGRSSRRTPARLLRLGGIAARPRCVRFELKAFRDQELLFRLLPGDRGVLAQAAGLRDDPMAWDHDDRRVAGTGGPDRPRRVRPAE